MSSVAMNSDRMCGAAALRADYSKRPGEHEVSIAVEILLGLPPRDREALTRYYLHRQSAEEIQSALHMSPAEFRELKAAARARWTATRRVAVSRKPADSQKNPAPPVQRPA